MRHFRCDKLLFLLTFICTLSSSSGTSNNGATSQRSKRERVVATSKSHLRGSISPVIEGAELSLSILPSSTLQLTPERILVQFTTRSGSAQSVPSNSKQSDQKLHRILENTTWSSGYNSSITTSSLDSNNTVSSKNVETTLEPSESPVASPTASPIVSFMEVPTSDRPVVAATTSRPSDSPVSPTGSPIVLTTDAPVSDPTGTPIETPTTRRPSRKPTRKPVTKEPTTDEPTANPVREPTTEEPTEEPTTEPTEVTNSPTMVPTKTGGEVTPEKNDDIIDSEGTSSNSTELVVPFTNVFLTLYIDAPAPLKLDIDEVQLITAHHILRQIQIVESLDEDNTNNNSILIVQEVANVTMSPISTYTGWVGINNTVLQSYEVAGAVVLTNYEVVDDDQKTKLSDEDSNEFNATTKRIHDIVTNAFETSKGKTEYIGLLRISSDTSLRRIYNIYEGSSNGVVPHDGDNDNTNDNNPSDGSPVDNNETLSNKRNPIKIAIIIAGAICGFAMLIVLGMLGYSYRDHLKLNQSKSTMKDGVESSPFSSSKEGNNDNKNPSPLSKSGSETIESSSADRKIDPPMQSATTPMASTKRTPKLQSPRQARSETKNRNKVSNETLFNQSPQSLGPAAQIYVSKDKNSTTISKQSQFLDDDDDIANALRTINVDADPSEVSSVYSYIESANLVDMIQDEAYSIGNGDLDVDDDLNTRNGAWSVTADEQMSIILGNRSSVVRDDSSRLQKRSTTSATTTSFFNKMLRNKSNTRGAAAEQSDNDTISTFGAWKDYSVPQESKQASQQSNNASTPSKMVIVAKLRQAKSNDSDKGGKVLPPTSIITSDSKVEEKSGDEKLVDTTLCVTSGKAEPDTESSTSVSSDDPDATEKTKYQHQNSSSDDEDEDETETEIVRATVAERRIAATALSYGNKYKSHQHQKQVMLPQKTRTNTSGVNTTDGTDHQGLGKSFNNLKDALIGMDQDQSDSDIHSVDGDQSLFSSFSRITNGTDLRSAGTAVGEGYKSSLGKPYENEDEEEDDTGIASSLMLPAAYNMDVRMIDTSRDKYWSDTDDDLSSTGGSIIASADPRNSSTYGYHGYNRDRPFNDLASF